VVVKFAIGLSRQSSFLRPIRFFVGAFMVSLSYSVSVWLFPHIFGYIWFIYLFIRKNIIGVETVVNIRWTTQAEDFVVRVWT